MPANFKTYEAQARLLAAVIAAHPELRLNYKGKNQIISSFLPITSPLDMFFAMDPNISPGRRPGHKCITKPSPVSAHPVAESQPKMLMRFQPLPSTMASRRR